MSRNRLPLGPRCLIPMKTWPRHVLIALLLLCGFALLACHQQPAADTPLAMASQSGYIGPKGELQQESSGYRTVIVFVHGLFGDGQTTWTNPATHAYWPELIRDDERDQWFRKADVFVYSYPSSFWGSGYTIGQIAEDMKAAFIKADLFRLHDEVVFICHSLGGVVVREYLQEHQDQAQKVSLIYFYGTPTEGSSLARIGKLLSANPQLRGLSTGDKNEELRDLQRRWRNMPKIPSRCAYETEKTRGLFVVVDEISASSLCNDTYPLPTDHIGIVKPANRGDRIYSLFQDAFDRRQENATVYIAKTTIQAGQRMQCTGAQGQEGMCVPVAPSVGAEAAPEPAKTAQSQAPTAQPEQPAEVSEVAAKPTGGKPVRSAPKTGANEVQQAPPSLSATNVGASPVPNGVARTNKYPSRPAGVSR